MGTLAKKKSLSSETIALRLSRDQLRLLAHPTPGLPLALAVALARSGLGHHQIGGPGPTLVTLFFMPVGHSMLLAGVRKRVFCTFHRARSFHNRAGTFLCQTGS